MEVRIKPTKISIYVNDKRRTAAQVKAETGCDYIINGGLFLWAWQACPWLKVDGKVCCETADWSAWGYSWNDVSDFCMSHDRGKANYISCVDLINPWNGPVKKPIYNADVGGKRGRSAIAEMPDGTLLLYCWPDSSAGARTPEALRDYLADLGAKTALMLDGGGSCQCIFPSGKVESSRIVHNFLCFWTDGSEKNTTTENTTQNQATGGGTSSMGTLKKGSKGTEVKVLQSRLNEVGNYGLEVDGDFGTNTYNAVRNFQDNTNLTVDGIVGPGTEAMLSRVAAYKTSSNALVRTAAKYIGLKEPDGDDSIIKAYNALAGTNFGMNTAWCQMFVVVAQKEAGMDPYVVASCTMARSYYKSKGMWRTAPTVGGLVYFDWDLSGDCDHVGIVAGIEGDTIYTIEGNAGGYSKDGVRVKAYAKSSKLIAGYADLGQPAPVTPEPPKAEVDNTPNRWAVDAIAKALTSGALQGDENGNLKLHQPLTKEDLFVVLDRLHLLD